jgi:hypothetical protein
MLKDWDIFLALFHYEKGLAIERPFLESRECLPDRLSLRLAAAHRTSILVDHAVSL